MKIKAIMIMTPKLRKDLHASFLGCKRISPIKRTRKRQIEKAKHMMEEYIEGDRLVVEEETIESKKINWCPMCKRPLNEEEE